ncbi:AbrB/MazE/SpoVT family DNA-binding domain-containing protein [Patescibacteria group bacterium]|nr:AbrB/MazE/SpoVT family DNA-binding domain-containing protein [Patescibacteria group bacterium]
MGITEVPVSSKGQITLPKEYRNMLHLGVNAKVTIISLRPGEIKIVATPKEQNMDAWVDGICGSLQDDSCDSLEELKKYKKEDLELEKKSVEE